MAPVIDVHTHMLTKEYVSLLERHGGPTYTLKAVTGGLLAIHLHDAPFMTPVPEMFDYPARIKMMDTVGIDVSVLSLSCPNVYWGPPEVSLQAARIMNDDMAAARARHHGRIEYLCSLPWQHAEGLDPFKGERLHLLLHLVIGTIPKSFQITGHLDRSSGRRQQVQQHRHPAPCNRRRFCKTE